MYVLRHIMFVDNILKNGGALGTIVQYVLDNVQNVLDIVQDVLDNREFLQIDFPPIFPSKFSICLNFQI